MDFAHLEQKWGRAYEDDAGGNEVFRPQGYAFAPSRGRDWLDLRKDAKSGWQVPGPDDRGQKVDGRWHLDDNGLLSFRASENAAPSRVYKVVSIEPDRLVLRPVP